ncbi:MAG: nickel pincer cofactor biosynthesis protein LarC [Endomicrobium sp.]|nr:nickel pincer cofactor biosynthesis protein LarC [Endomicrobium sp.]
MRVLYLECSMGVAGDMLMGALLELTDNKGKMLKQINSIGLPNIKIDAKSVVKCGIKGTRICVKINGIEEISSKKPHIHNDYLFGSGHTTLKKIKNILTQLRISQKAKKNALSIYNLIEKAEITVHHGEHCDEQHNKHIHFHEVGSMDAIADIVGVCMLMEYIDPQEVLVSPINVGSGFVHCAHGSLSVPAPATAYILKNIPIYSARADEELCTPTGAAIIKHFATRFEQLPRVCIKKIGYGMGIKNFKTANYTRAFLGETENNFDAIDGYVTQLQCNLDDTTGEAVGFVINLLLQKGALDVFIIPIQMKKNRPAFLLTCICSEKKANFFVELILRHTTTFGIRKVFCQRHTLKHKISIHRTQYGNIRIKTGEGYNVKKSKAEYNDIAKIASSNNISFNETINLLSNSKNNKNDS